MKRISKCLLALLCAGCIHLPEVGGKPLPKIGSNGPVTYRDLSDIPDLPAKTPESEANAAIGQLSQSRGMTQSAAGELRHEPFIDPPAAPPGYSF